MFTIPQNQATVHRQHWRPHHFTGIEYFTHLLTSSNSEWWSILTAAFFSSVLIWPHIYSVSRIISHVWEKLEEYTYSNSERLPETASSGTFQLIARVHSTCDCVGACACTRSPFSASLTICAASLFYCLRGIGPHSFQDNLITTDHESCSPYHNLGSDSYIHFNWCLHYRNCNLCKFCYSLC